jgi:NAD(P)-dependent dehydrogenase (short-subunit alcohol dehydrogenase family)
MDLNLIGRRALVTGSSSGLGCAIAARLAHEGAAIVVHGRDAERAAAVAAELRDTGADVAVAIGDLATDAGAEQVRAAALLDGPVDILVNNAGFYASGTTWADITPDDWAEMYQANVVGSVRMIKAFVPDMRARGWGRVVQISSVQSTDPMASQPHYAASNAAREALARSLSRELRHTGVTSNAIAAGGISTPAVRNMLNSVAQAQGWGDHWPDIQRKATEAFSPNDAGRFGSPEEYAALVAFLASPLADFITGASLSMDGGWYDVPAPTT